MKKIVKRLFCNHDFVKDYGSVGFVYLTCIKCGYSKRGVGYGSCIDNVLNLTQGIARYQSRDYLKTVAHTPLNDNETNRVGWDSWSKDAGLYQFIKGLIVPIMALFNRDKPMLDVSDYPEIK